MSRQPCTARFSVLGALVLALPGCLSGGQSTDDGGECSEETTVLPTDDAVASQAGIAPSDVTRWALGAGSVRAEWHGPPPGIQTNAPPGDTAVLYSLSRREGDAVETDGWCGPPAIQVPVRLDLSTEDGLLSESVEATLVAHQAEFAVVNAELDFGALEGAFSWTADASNLSLVQPSITMSITPFGVSGSFGAHFQKVTRDAVSDVPGAGHLLAWPAGSPCPIGEVHRGLETAPPLWQEALSKAQTQDWASAEETGYRLSVQASAFVCDARHDATSAPATLRIAGPEGIDVSISGALSEQDGRLEFAARPDARLSGSVEEFAARFGDFGLELAGYDAAALELTLWASADRGAAILEIVGYTDDCQASCDSTGCGGCPPLTRHLLRSVSFSL